MGKGNNLLAEFKKLFLGKTAFLKLKISILFFPFK